MCQVTLSPCVIVMVAGEKPVLLIWTVTVAAEPAAARMNAAAPAAIAIAPILPIVTSLACGFPSEVFRTNGLFHVCAR